MKSENEIRTMIGELMSTREMYHALGDSTAEDACCQQIDTLLWIIGDRSGASMVNACAAEKLGEYLSSDTINFLAGLGYDDHAYMTHEDAVYTISEWMHEGWLDGIIAQELTPDILTWYNNYIIM